MQEYIYIRVCMAKIFVIKHTAGTLVISVRFSKNYICFKNAVF
jgi:hypothetical protein